VKEDGRRVSDAGQALNETTAMKLRPQHPGEREARRERLALIGCQETHEHLHRHVEGETESFLSRLLEDHLSRCPACRALRAQLEEERRWVLEEALVTPALSAGFRKKVLTRVESQRQETQRARWRGAFFRVSGAAAVLAVAVLAYRETPVPETSSVAVAPTPPAEAVGAAEEVRGAGRVDDLAVPALWDGSAPAPPLRRLTPIQDPVSSRPSGIPYFGEVVHAAATLGRPGRPTAFVGWEAGPCLPDPNQDGRMDPNDVAFSCQVLMGGEPPALRDEPGHAVSDPDCEDICLRV
jgi:hypothetical protein